MIPPAQIFIPTYEKDLGWLEFSIRSIEKFWTSPFTPIIVADEDCLGKLSESGLDVRYVKHWSDGRRDQVYLKMMADTFVDAAAETILFMDSDCLFTKTSVTDDFCIDGRPMVKMMSYNDACAKWPHHREAYDGYKRSVWECLQIGSVYEYMQVQPFLFFKDTVANVREEIERIRGCPLKNVAERFHSSHFSEFNLFGAYAHEQEDDRYCFLTPENWGEPRVRQFDGWGGSPDSSRPEIESILG